MTMSSPPSEVSSEGTREALSGGTASVQGLRHNWRSDRPRSLASVPTPVGPLGPDEIDPNDPDLWDWNTGDESPRPQPLWIRVTAWTIAGVFTLVVIVSLLR